MVCRELVKFRELLERKFNEILRQCVSETPRAEGFYIACLRMSAIKRRAARLSTPILAEANLFFKTQRGIGT